TNETQVPSALVSGSTAIALGLTGNNEANGFLTAANPNLGSTVSCSVGAVDLIVHAVGNWPATAAADNPSVVPPNDACTGTSRGTATSTSQLTINPTTVTQGFPVTFSGSVSAQSGTTAPVGQVQIREGGPTGTLLATATVTAAPSGTTSNWSVTSSLVPPG